MTDKEEVLCGELASIRRGTPLDRLDEIVLSEIGECIYNHERTPNNQIVTEDGRYTVVGANGVVGKTNLNPNAVGKTITVTRSGDYKKVGFYNEPIFVKDSVHSVKVINEDKVLPEYLFLLLKKKEPYLNHIKNGNIVNFIPKKVLKALPVATEIPPIDVQKETWSTYKLLSETVDLLGEEQETFQKIKKQFIKNIEQVEGDL